MPSNGRSLPRCVIEHADVAALSRQIKALLSGSLCTSSGQSDLTTARISSEIASIRSSSSRCLSSRLRSARATRGIRECQHVVAGVPNGAQGRAIAGLDWPGNHTRVVATVFPLPDSGTIERAGQVSSVCGSSRTAAFLDDAGALPQGDDGIWPALAGWRARNPRRAPGCSMMYSPSPSHISRRCEKRLRLFRYLRAPSSERQKQTNARTPPPAFRERPGRGSTPSPHRPPVAAGE